MSTTANIPASANIECAVEQAVLGALLLDADTTKTWDAVKNHLTDSDFNVRGHSEIYHAISKFHVAGQIPDVISIAEHLKNADVGGLEYIHALTNSVSSFKQIAFHAQKLREFANKRSKNDALLSFRQSLSAVGSAADFETAFSMAQALIERVSVQQLAPKPKLKYRLPEGRPASELVAQERVPSDFVLPGFVAGTVGALISPGGTGKSMLAMELAALVAGANMLGLDWPGIKHGNVLILATEDPERELYNRWSDLGRHLDAESREACARVRVIPMLGQRFDIMEEDHFQALLDKCQGKRLLLLDTFRRIHTMDENDGGAMAQVVMRLEEIAATTGCAILFLHHTNKLATLSGQGDVQQASRGSSVLVDNIRFQMFMVGMGKDDKPDCDQVDPEFWKEYVRMGVSKVNYGPRVGNVWLKRADGGILVPAEFPTSSVATRKASRRAQL